MDRQNWMGLLARARPTDLAGLLPDLPPSQWLRPPEVGTVMVQGRIGGTGAAFHLGEITVTRCSLQLTCGTVGHAHVQGRDRDHAHRAALVDALMQTGAATELQAHVLAPLARIETEARAERAGRAQATKVDFFTLVRGEDA